jgi:hypothetical protein
MRKRWILLLLMASSGVFFYVWKNTPLGPPVTGAAVKLAGLEENRQQPLALSPKSTTATVTSNEHVKNEGIDLEQLGQYQHMTPQHPLNTLADGKSDTHSLPLPVGLKLVSPERTLESLNEGTQIEILKQYEIRPAAFIEAFQNGKYILGDYRSNDDEEARKSPQVTHVSVDGLWCELRIRKLLAESVFLEPGQRFKVSKVKREETVESDFIDLYLEEASPIFSLQCTQVPRVQRRLQVADFGTAFGGLLRVLENDVSSAN